jgi:hypothetical protein
MRKNAEATVQDTDWGPNADGWEFDIENRSNRDLRIDYAPTSNVASADKLIPAGKSGKVKGTKGFFDPNDMDFKYSATGGPGSATILIRSTFGKVSRFVRNDPDGAVTAYFPDQPQNEVQKVIYQATDFWGPNFDGWTVVVHNQCSWDLNFSSFSNIKTRPDWIRPGTDGDIKGEKSVFGGPANIGFTLVVRNQFEHQEHGRFGITLKSDDAGNVTRAVTGSGEVAVTYIEQTRDRVQEFYFKNKS